MTVLTTEQAVVTLVMTRGDGTCCTTDEQPAAMGATDARFVPTVIGDPAARWRAWDWTAGVRRGRPWPVSFRCGCRLVGAWIRASTRSVRCGEARPAGPP